MMANLSEGINFAAAEGGKVVIMAYTGTLRPRELPFSRQINKQINKGTKPELNYIIRESSSYRPMRATAQVA